MTIGNNASNVSMLALLIFVSAVTLSDAFAPPHSVASIRSQIQLQQKIFTKSNLFASTAPSRSGNELAVIDSWELLPDGRIKGVISDSGDSVTTSPLKKKNGLKEQTTVRTVSGSRYKLGTPASVNGAGNNLSADRLGVPRATLGGVNSNGVRATQPLKSLSTASPDGLMQNFLANKSRATMPLQSQSSGSVPVNNKKNDGSEKKVDLLTPLVGGASAIAIGAAIGTGVISDKGVDLSKIKNAPDPREVFKSVQSMGLPDIKFLTAPSIPSVDVSLPKLERLPTLTAPKLPDIAIQFPDVSLPQGLDVTLPKEMKMPDLPSLSVPIPDGMKNLGDAASGALDGVLPKKKAQINSVGQGPYRVPLPYLDQKIVQAEKQRKAQEAAEKALAAEMEEAARMQKIREEEAAKLQTVRAEAEAEFNARQEILREQEERKRVEFEERIQREADERVKKAEEEAALLRSEVEQTRLAAVEKEKAASEEAARLKMEAEAALLKEQAAKEEFTRKLELAELAKLKEAQDFSVKLAEAEEAAAKGRALEEEAAAKRKLAEEAANREAVATAEVRKASIGASEARKATYPSPSLSTYKAWQERQRTEYRTRMASVAESVAELSESGVVVPASLSSPSKDNLSTYKNWQQTVAAKQIVSVSADPVKAAYITGAPAPVVNQLVSGITKLSDTTQLTDTTKFSDAAIALNGDLGKIIAGSAAVIGGIYYANELQKIQDDLAESNESELDKRYSSDPPSTSSAAVQTLPPIVPSSSTVQGTQVNYSSATKAIDMKPLVEDLRDESTSVTKEIRAPPSPPKPEVSFSATNSVTEKLSPVTTEVEKRKGNAPVAPEVESNGISYLESMSTSTKVPLKSSYSPFNNAKKPFVLNDSLYSPPVDNNNEENTMPQNGASPYDATLTDSASSTPKGLSYLDRISDSVQRSSATPKKSYSPFSTMKSSQEKSDSLYDPPAARTEYPSPNEHPVPDLTADTIPNQGNYLNGLDDSSKSNLKKSYSPFGTKPKAVSRNGLYSPEEINEVSFYSTSAHENDLPLEDERDAIPVTKYLEQLIVPVSDKAAFGKKSFSPFGARGKKPKGQSSGSDSLYKPPSRSSVMIDDLPSDEERDAIPVAKYLEQLIVPVSDKAAFGKKSFSPFGARGEKPKGQSSGSDSLYKPPSGISMMTSDVHSEEETKVGFEEDTMQLFFEELKKSDFEEDMTLNSPNEQAGASKPDEGDDRVTQAYGEWLNFYKKKFNEDRYAIFASNFIIAAEYHAETGKPLVMNEYSDLSAEEYEQSVGRIRNAYKEWCFRFEKEFDDSRYSTFAKNFEREEEHALNTGNPVNLTEYADLSEEELNKISRAVSQDGILKSIEEPTDSSYTRESAVSNLSTMENRRIHIAYKEWCNYFKKDFCDIRFQIFSTNYKVAQKFHEAYGTPLMLNEFSDLTKIEFDSMSNSFVNETNRDDFVVEERISSAYKQWCAWYKKDFSHDRLQIFASNFLILERYNGELSNTSPLCFNEYSDLTEEEFNNLI